VACSSVVKETRRARVRRWSHRQKGLRPGISGKPPKSQGWRNLAAQVAARRSQGPGQDRPARAAARRSRDQARGLPALRARSGIARARVRAWACMAGDKAKLRPEPQHAAAIPAFGMSCGLRQAHRSAETAVTVAVLPVERDIEAAACARRAHDGTGAGIWPPPARAGC